MAVTEANIRALLNYPRGLLGDTITEYISMETEYITKIARGADYLGDATNQVTTAQKEAAIKALVARDCLLVLIDTIPSFVPEKEQGQQDIRLRSQLASFEKRADKAVSAIAERGGTAFATGSTDTRLETS